MSMSEIIPGKLYLGSLYDSLDEEQLNKYNIKSVLNLSHQVGNTQLINWHWPLHDGSGNSIQDIENIMNILSNRISIDCPVLVHCLAGVSRSATIVSLYLAETNFWSFDKAVEHVVKIREKVEPNSALRKLAIEYLCKRSSNKV